LLDGGGEEKVQMPYLECPGCRLSLYSAAGHSRTADACAVCGTSLAGATQSLRSEAGGRTLRREFPSTPAAVASARHSLGGLRGELGDPVHLTAELLVSELVTNSVKHSKVPNGVIELVACITSSVVRVDVSDDGEGFDLSPLGRDRVESGRGLQLVQELADRWGRQNGLRRSVWFEIDRPPSRGQNGSVGATLKPPFPELQLVT
jgi:anti-sigma regulatory factor (Ser/Thr protein kinase)